MISKKETAKYFMPYQKRYIIDTSRYKIVEKSRRIGMTYAESYDNTAFCALNKGQKVWFSSADLSASEEFIDYIEYWARVLSVGAKKVGEVIIDSDDDVTAHRVRFASGSEVNAISSNPSKFRSKGGRVILDEFAHHKNAEKLFAAAKPSMMWGSEMRIISTHNGDQSYFNFLLNEVKKGVEGSMHKWALHRTTLEEAIEQGLVDKILKRSATPEDIEEFKQDCFSGMTQEAINEEYFCIPRSDSSSHLLSYELLNPIEREDILSDIFETKIEGNLYIGFDVARRKHFSVIWVLEQLGEILYTRKLYEMRNMSFENQREILYGVLEHPQLRRCCIDASGLGMQIAEEAQKRFGTFKVEPVAFTNAVKEDLATHTYVMVEGRKVLIPRDKIIRDDLYSVRAVTTSAGNVRYEAEETEHGHADRFWALALALHSAKSNAGPVTVASRGRRESNKLMDNFF